MKEADIERIIKHVWRTYLHNGQRVYLWEFQVRAAVQAALDLGIVRLNDEAPRVLPYSTEKIL